MLQPDKKVCYKNLRQRSWRVSTKLLCCWQVDVPVRLPGLISSFSKGSNFDLAPKKLRTLHCMETYFHHVAQMLGNDSETIRRSKFSPCCCVSLCPCDLCARRRGRKSVPCFQGVSRQISKLGRFNLKGDINEIQVNRSTSRSVAYCRDVIGLRLRDGSIRAKPEPGLLFGSVRETGRGAGHDSTSPDFASEKRKSAFCSS